MKMKLIMAGLLSAAITTAYNVHATETYMVKAAKTEMINKAVELSKKTKTMHDAVVEQIDASEGLPEDLKDELKKLIENYAHTELPAGRQAGLKAILAANENFKAFFDQNSYEKKEEQHKNDSGDQGSADSKQNSSQTEKRFDDKSHRYKYATEELYKSATTSSEQSWEISKLSEPDQKIAKSYIDKKFAEIKGNDLRVTEKGIKARFANTIARLNMEGHKE